MKNFIVYISFCANLFCFSVFNYSAYGQAGSPDVLFDGDGIVITDFNSLHDNSRKVLVQPDGKIVLVGWSGLNPLSDIALSRYNTNGSLDSTFGTGGRSTASVHSNATGMAAVLQTDGKIVVAGMTDADTVAGTYDNNMLVFRFNSDGSVDSSYNSTGYNEIDLGSTMDKGFSIAIQQDGKTLMGGYTQLAGTTATVVVRFTTDGIVDSTFNADGILITDIPSSIYEQITCMLIQPDGKIVCGGQTGAGSNTNNMLMRILSDGTMDSTFNGTGIATYSWQSSQNTTSSIALQGDGKIVLSGHSYINLDYKMCIERYDADGSIDSTFDQDGIVFPGFYFDSYGNAVLIQPDSSILVAGHVSPTPYDIGFARHLPDGTVDSSFGINGKLEMSLGTGNDYIYSLALQNDGKIIAGGSTYNTSTANLDFALLRLLNNLNVGIIDNEEQNNSLLIYPHPVAGSTTIEFTLLKAQKLSAFLFDNKGRLVRTFFSDRFTPEGMNKEQLNLENVAPGNYVLQLKNSSFQLSIKIVIL